MKLTIKGFLTIHAKLGDILGRKTIFIIGLLSFSLFSILCGQGFGASGIYSLTLVIAPTIIKPGQMPQYIALVSTVFALASVVGPLMGGAISETGQWKWVFLFKSVPDSIINLLPLQ